MHLEALLSISDEISDDDDNIRNPAHRELRKLLATSLLSRIIEITRFTSAESMLNDVATEECLEELLRQHLEHEAVGSDNTAAALAALSTAWDQIQQLAGGPGSLTMTVRELLEFDLPGFPTTTFEQRRRLQLLADDALVAKESVGHVLFSPSGEKFVEELPNKLPGAVLSEVLEGMKLHPKKHSLPKLCAAELLCSQRRVASFVPFAIILSICLALILRSNVAKEYTFTQTASGKIGSAWASACARSHGINSDADSTSFCHQEALSTLDEVRVYFGQELVNLLWGDSGPPETSAPSSFSVPNGVSSMITVAAGAQTTTTPEQPTAAQALSPMESAGIWPFGALLLRVSSPTSAFSDISCGAMNLSNSNLVKEPRLPQKYSCSASAFTAIPFSEPKLEALDRAKQFAASVMSPMMAEAMDPSVNDTAIIAQFGLFRPDDGRFARITISVALSATGAVLPRCQTQVIDTRFAETAAVILILYVTFVAVCIVIELYFWKVGGFSVAGDLLLPLSEIVVLALSYSCFSRVHSVDVVQTTFVEEGFDAIAGDYSVGVDLLGCWLFLFASRLIRYLVNLSKVDAVDRAVSGIGQAAALLVIFGLVYVAFVIGAMGLLGPYDSSLSSFVAANAKLISTFWSGNSSHLHLATRAPFLSSIVYFWCRILVVFAVSTMLTVAFLAPVWKAPSQAGFRSAALAEAAAMIANQSSCFTRATWAVQFVLMPVVRCIFECLFFLPVSRKWLKFFNLVERVYGYDAFPSSNVCSYLGAVRDLTHFLDVRRLEDATGCWVTCSAFESNGRIMVNDPVGCAMLKAAIARVTGNGLLRNMYTLAILEHADTHTARLADYFHCRFGESTRTDAWVADRGPISASPVIASSQSKRRFLPMRKIVTPSVDEITRSDTSFQRAVPGKHWQVRRRKCPTERLRFRMMQSFADQLQAHSGHILFAVVVIVLYLWLAVSTVGVTQQASWLGESIDLALFGPTDHCTCTGRFGRGGCIRNISDVYAFFVSVLGPNVFPLGANGSVLWDPRIRLAGHLTIRQVRARQVPCAAPPKGSTARLRQKCFGGPRDVDNGESQPPASVDVGSVLHDEAYQYRTQCAEDAPVEGIFASYQCAGYTVHVSSASDVQNIVSSRWIDSGTRFVAVAGVFAIHSVAATKYAMYIELPGGGDIAFARSQVSAPIGPHPVRHVLYIGLLLVGFDVLDYLVRVVVGLVCGICGNVRARSRMHSDVPVLNLCIVCYVIISGLVLGEHVVVVSSKTESENSAANISEEFGGSSSSSSSTLRDSITLVLVVLSATQMLILYAVLPVFEWISFRALALRRFLIVATYKLPGVIPLYVGSFACFFFAGHFLFGRFVQQFATLESSFFTVLNGFLNTWSISGISAYSLAAGTLYSAAFFVMSFIVMLGIVLSVALSAAADAETYLSSYCTISELAVFHNSPLHTGPLCRALLSFVRTHKRCIARVCGPHSSFPLIVTSRGRLLTPLECLSYHQFVGCYELLEAVNSVKYFEFPQSLLLSLIFELACHASEFRTRCCGASKEDARLERELVRSYEDSFNTSPFGDECEMEPVPAVEMIRIKRSNPLFPVHSAES